MACSRSHRFEITVTVFGEDEEKARVSFKERVADILAEDRKWSYCGGSGPRPDDGFHSCRYGNRPLSELERIEDLERGIRELKTVPGGQA